MALLTVRLSVATYNIRRCIGSDGRRKPERTVQVLKDLQADVIALQEVDTDLEQEDGFLHYAEKETGLCAIAGPTLIPKDRSLWKRGSEFRKNGPFGTLKFELSGV